VLIEVLSRGVFRKKFLHLTAMAIIDFEVAFPPKAILAASWDILVSILVGHEDL
jgi:hypothetical protein